MNSLLIVIFVSFIHNCRGQCTPIRPFFMTDQSCAGFNEICMKNDNPQCKSLLDACKQCPPNNYTVVAMLDLAARIRGNQNVTKDLLEKNVNTLREQLLARIALVENKSGNTILLLLVIIVLLVLLIIILILEVRFKCITKCCECMTKKGSKRIYRDLKKQNYKMSPDGNKLSDIRTDIIGLDQKFDSKFAELLRTVETKLEARQVPETAPEYSKEAIDNLKSVLPKLINSTQFLLYKESEKFMQVIAVEKGTVTINSIFDDVTPVKIDYTNVELVSSIKDKMGKKLNSDPNDLILFANKTYLEGNKTLFQIDSLHGLDFKYCHLMKLDKVETSSKVIKSGDFSDIIEGKHPWTNAKIILKRYQLLPIRNLRENKAFLNELITFQITRNDPRFVQLLGVFKNNEYFYIAMEQIVGGSVKDFLESKAPLSKATIAKWARQILEALKHLHKHNIIHRNVKPSNILICENGDVKLSSFGVSKYVQGGDQNYLMAGFEQSKVGTYRYMAPEVCNNEPYGVQADVWSFGATFGEIATGKPPYDGKNEMSALMEIGKSRTITFELDDSSKVLKDFINACLVGDPKKRATVETLLKHDFLRQQ